ncbi:MAG TPA: helix-turn-helix domain-containing protein [Candidatus Thermoplasmatota archaeon]|nr:helix-turn-helix domain-containing protein [Candidatus Thermoplasmatota archaeon]
MTQTYLKGTTATVHRIDLPCEQTGFTTPPFDVHLKFLPSPADGAGWTLLAHAAAGKPDILARWLDQHPGIGHVRVAPGLAPKLFRASTATLPPIWATVASFVKVHHLDLAADGHAAWFIEGVRDQVWALVQHLEAAQRLQPATGAVRCRPVAGHGRSAILSRRQFEALSTAVAMGYYEIPHRIDLRTLAKATGVSLGSVSELLRRAEGAILTHYVDASLMGWPLSEEDELRSFRPMVNMLRQ